MKVVYKRTTKEVIVPPGTNLYVLSKIMKEEGFSEKQIIKAMAEQFVKNHSLRMAKSREKQQLHKSKTRQ